MSIQEHHTEDILLSDNRMDTQNMNLAQASYEDEHTAGAVVDGGV